MKTHQWPEAKEVARLLIVMGEFMDQGHTYEETYAHAIQNSQSPNLQMLFRDMLKTGEEGQRSPIDIMQERTDIVPRWLYLIFWAGASSGVPTIWIRGGKAFLKSSQNPGISFMFLFMTALDCGVPIDEASQASAEWLGLDVLKNFFGLVSEESEHSPMPIAAACRQFPELFSSDLVRDVEESEKSPDPLSAWGVLAEKLADI